MVLPTTTRALWRHNCFGEAVVPTSSYDSTTQNAKGPRYLLLVSPDTVDRKSNEVDIVVADRNYGILATVDFLATVDNGRGWPRNSDGCLFQSAPHAFDVFKVLAVQQDSKISS